MSRSDAPLARGSSAMPPPIVNALSIDVEDYFQVWALSPCFPRSTWDSVPIRVERNVDRILDLLADLEVKATFFTLGYVAARCPAIVRRLVAEGHELASHGFNHELATDLSPERLTEDLRDAKDRLEQISGVAVTGYRAPSFSIGASNQWAFDCIAEAGYRYSSSIYPVQHDLYGMPDAPRFPFTTRPGLIEIPVTTTRFLKKNLPAGGGGYFRFLPYAVSRWMIRRVNRIDQRAAIFYFHPWEIDAEQPRVRGIPIKSRFRHYINLTRTFPRLKRLLAEFHWDRIDSVYRNELARV